MTNPSPEDPDYERWLHELKRESEALQKRQCPYTGELLTTHGNVQIPQGTLSCSMCDCFGYNPAEVDAAVAAGGEA